MKVKTYSMDKYIGVDVKGEKDGQEDEIKKEILHICRPLFPG